MRTGEDRRLAQARVSEVTIYNWKSKFGHIDVSEAKELRAFVYENGKLKKLFTEQMLDVTASRATLKKM